MDAAKSHRLDHDEPMMDRSEEALVALRRILRATELSSRALAKKTGLTPSQLVLLQVLAKTGSSAPSFLSREISLSQGTVTAMIDKLSAKGLVETRRDTIDKRRRFVDITDAGRAALFDAPSIIQERFSKRFADLEEWEKAFLIAALERIAAMVDADELDAAPMLDVGALNKTME